MDSDKRAELREARLSAHKSRIGTEKHRLEFERYEKFLKDHPDYNDRGICVWREERWVYEHPAVTRSFAIRQEFISLDPDRNRPISRATSDREIAEGMLRYIQFKEWHGEADLITIGFWLTLTEEKNIAKMNADLLTAWLGNALGKKARGQYQHSTFKEVEI